MRVWKFGEARLSQMIIYAFTNRATETSPFIELRLIQQREITASNRQRVSEDECLQRLEEQRVCTRQNRTNTLKLGSAFEYEPHFRYIN